ncbi:diadenosine tetraphosphate (Ap4A) HIT family hydrolase [Nocardia tenerifensis]|uniref:Diadenosine tetraphosphate (Ap4A) HIT family hydrolase n=1 Tax=Nocardia tenerifensis TaxID=228006 RepID=A0A318KGW2_9NOCA|nr:HIT domain-containing protein [Nocardia tenerifensis]PXX71502.1 diadenosine tetraphosphate (Ap4A) HIT family hydrolase [Nocardia tenerifensis]
MSSSDRAVTVDPVVPQQLLLPLGPLRESVRSDHAVAQDDSPSPDPSCLFCRHADPTANTVVRRRGTMYARWDNFPASPGHVEIVPFRHILSFFDMNDRETRDLHILAQSVRNTLYSRYRPDGFTIGVNDGSAAGRTVPHLHMHIIPRWHGDVPDPRGGIRRVFAECDPDSWS